MILQDQFYLKQMTTLSSLLMTFTFTTLGCRHKPSNLKGLSSCISVALCNFSTMIIHDKMHSSRIREFMGYHNKAFVKEF